MLCISPEGIDLPPKDFNGDKDHHLYSYPLYLYVNEDSVILVKTQDYIRFADQFAKIILYLTAEPIEKELQQFKNFRFNLIDRNNAEAKTERELVGKRVSSLTPMDINLFKGDP